MTKKEVYEKFGKAEMLFASYYKYSFTFTGSFEGYDINASYGGDADSIYRFDVNRDDPIHFDALGWDFICIEKDGERVFEHYDY